MKIVVVFLLVCSFFSCVKNTEVTSKNKFSKQFFVEVSDSIVNITTQNFKGAVLSDIRIVPNQLPQKIICLNTTYLAYFEALNALDKVVAGVDLDRIPKQYSGIVNLSSANLDLEKIMGLQPDLIIASSYQEKEIAFLKNKYPVLIVNEFWENHPLGRAEWILPFGTICGKHQEAQQLFAGIQDRYLQVAKTAKLDSTRVLNASKYNQNYFLPGCKSLIAQYFKDVKIAFECTGESAESIEISEEQAFSYFKTSDLILFFDWHLQSRNYQQILTELGAVNQNLPIIYCNTYLSNYFQNSILHPDEILLELKTVVQNPNFQGQYFKRLNP